MSFDIQVDYTDGRETNFIWIMSNQVFIPHLRDISRNLNLYFAGQFSPGISVKSQEIPLVIHDINALVQQVKIDAIFDEDEHMRQLAFERLAYLVEKIQQLQTEPVLEFYLG